MVIQLAKKVLGLRVVATASREESRNQSLRLGADVVISHREALQPQLQAQGIDGVDLIFSANDLEPYLEQYAAIIKPLGKIIQITNVQENVDLSKFFFKRVSIIFEFMFSRSMFDVEPERQGAILEEVARLVDNGTVLPIASLELPLSLENLRHAHELQASGSTIGKIVLTLD
jgi:NADPH:quinone reductase-like Zn-dependent oxidoreductase